MTERDDGGFPPAGPPSSTPPARPGLGFDEPTAPPERGATAPGSGSRWPPGAGQDAPTAPIPAPPGGPAAAPPPAPVAAPGVPPRANPLPPPRSTTGLQSMQPGPAPRPDPRTARPATSSRLVTKSRTAKLVLRRVDPWSVFLYSLVASIFLGIALVVAAAVLYGMLSKLGVLSSVNKLIADVTTDPGSTTTPSPIISSGKVLTFAALIAALNVVLITALSTLGAFLYNLCAVLTGGIEVTLSDRDSR